RPLPRRTSTACADAESDFGFGIADFGLKRPPKSAIRNSQSEIGIRNRRTAVMRSCLAITFILALIGGSARSGEPTPDERLLTEHKMPTDGPGLLAFVRQLVIDDKLETRLKKLVKQLGDDDFDAREEASRLLTAAGAPARPFLREALTATDAEV